MSTLTRLRTILFGALPSTKGELSKPTGPATTRSPRFERPPCPDAKPQAKGAGAAAKPRAPAPDNDRVAIPLHCGRTDKPYLALFGRNRITKQYWFEKTVAPEPGEGGVSPAITFDIRLFPWRLVPCHWCEAKSGPVECSGCHRFVCEHGFDRQRSYFHCARSCGAHGPLIYGLEHIHGTGAQAPRFRRG